MLPGMNAYAATLEALSALPLEEQESVVEVVRLRLAEQRRAELIATVKKARKEFAAGEGKPVTVAAILRQAKP
jgi:hypothetical protein